LVSTVSTDGPPTPNARIIFLKTTGSFLLEQTGWQTFAGLDYRADIAGDSERAAPGTHQETSLVKQPS
jgi:hypothetical protein